LARIYNKTISKEGENKIEEKTKTINNDKNNEMAVFDR
jgi:hypothetical protein